MEESSTRLLLYHALGYVVRFGTHGKASDRARCLSQGLAQLPKHQHSFSTDNSSGVLEAIRSQHAVGWAKMETIRTMIF